jgi:predicted MPP superfamily phosphohydrolase
MAPYLSNEADVSLLERVEKDETVVVLAHNPDTITNFPNDHADLTLV